jgi:hypothetical protein
LLICALPAVAVPPKPSRLLAPLAMVADPALAFSKKLIEPPAFVMLDVPALVLPLNCTEFAPTICQVAPLSVIFEFAAVAFCENSSMLPASALKARPTV